ncbi:hypothetical protein BDZ91DRAFT_743944 [Kalaharituber pfeilii]|nr:hypothetical protein BDZ91DRAFT_743944 [Kalaharituber pfeilii]
MSSYALRSSIRTGSTSDPQPPPPPMAAVTSLSNPVSADEYLVFFNDKNYQLSVVKQYKTDLEKPLFDYGIAPTQDVPSGNIANPSSLTAVLFDSMICVYGVLQGTTAGDLLVCRLSPGFNLLNIGEIPLATSSCITACSDGEQNGSLFYLVIDADGVPRIRVITLPGTFSTSEQVPITFALHRTTYLGSAYGVLGSVPPSAYVGAQDIDNNVNVFSRKTEVSARISTAKGLKNTPIALVFVDQSLVVYFFGVVGAGSQPDSPPVYRAVTKGLNQGFNFKTLDQAPAPNGYTQLTAIANRSTKNDGLGSVILTYVENGSNQLVSWEDHLDGFHNEPIKD